MQLRRFTPAGLDAFRQYIMTLKHDKTKAPPPGLLTDSSLTEAIKPATDCPDAKFPNRLAAAEHLDKVLSPPGLADSFDDVGLWAWLALRFFDQLMPMDDPKIPKLHKSQMGTDVPRFIPTDHYTDRHRHLLRHPLQVYRRVGKDKGMCFLVQPVYRPGDVIEQIASRRMYSWYKEMVATLSELVVDIKGRKIRDNASTSARRLHDVLDQFDCTWDLGFIAKDLLIPMLPQEFIEFPGRRKSSKKAAVREPQEAAAAR